jgi:hypothetical protein
MMGYSSISTSQDQGRVQMVTGLSQRRLEFAPGADHAGCVVDEVAMKRAFCFPCKYRSTAAPCSLFINCGMGNGSISSSCSTCSNPILTITEIFGAISK